MELEEVKTKLRRFICEELIRRPEYALEEDEPMISGGLIDSFSLAYIGVFIEDEFGVYIPDNELTVANMDTLNKMAVRILRG